MFRANRLARFATTRVEAAGKDAVEASLLGLVPGFVPNGRLGGTLGRLPLCSELHSLV